ncbi:helix-turn-helix domain-containing protein [Streptomyces liangshanensis]|uniref:helix-turn-helix domain-containing protein n=1 Tax=Streptomyces liangshanensis TaxID=2717324 RepID=UPI0036D93127
MSRHGELGTALHRWRDRITPAEAGLPADESRRPPGLRREELAGLTGLSVEYIVRLEQGRATSPSLQVLTTLARALRLSDGEHRHLFLLAGQSPPATGHVSDHVPPSVRRLLGRLGGTPCAVYDAAWNLITWNPLWAALLGDPSLQQGRGRNAAWQHFAGLPSRVSHTLEQEARYEAAVVADLRAATARYPTDEHLRFLIGDLRRVSARFGQLWNSRIAGFHDSDTKTVHHPDVGPVALDYDTFVTPGNDLRIVTCSAAPGTPEADRLKLLDVIGPERMAEADPTLVPDPALSAAPAGPVTSPTPVTPVTSPAPTSAADH